MERSHKIGDLRPHDDRDLTAAEVVAASLVVLAADAILSAYLWYRMGLRVEPFAVLLVSLTTAGAIPVALAKRAVSNRAETLAFGAIVALAFSWLVWLSRPDLLPMGRGPDLTGQVSTLCARFTRSLRSRSRSSAGYGFWIGPLLLSALPKDIVNSVDILARFGPSAVVTRRGQPSCPRQGESDRENSTLHH